MIELTMSSNIDNVIKELQRKELLVNNPPLSQIAEEVRADIEINLSAPKSYDGSGLKPLSKEYLAWKQKKGISPEIFQGKKGWLVQDVKKRKITKDWYQIFIAPRRAKVMFYLDQQGRKAFGISERAMKQVRGLYVEFLRKFI